MQKKGYYNKLKNNSSMEIEREYRKAYKAKHSQKQRLMYGNDQSRKNKLNIKFNNWIEEATNQKNDVTEGKKSKESFFEWLHKPID